MSTTPSSAPAPFKECPCCHYLWTARDGLLADPEIKCIGYQVNFVGLKLGLFLFDHLPCRGTLALPAGDFADMHDGPVYARRMTGTSECPRYCLNVQELRPCPAKCECAYVRDVLQKILAWPKAK